MAKADPLKPSLAILAALGSVAVHVEEGISHDGHPFDFVAMQAALAAPEVQEWIKAMGVYLPRKRDTK